VCKLSLENIGELLNKPIYKYLLNLIFFKIIEQQWNNWIRYKYESFGWQWKNNSNNDLKFGGIIFECKLNNIYL